MIHFTTFILTLLLAHIALAVPACGDVAPPEDTTDMYDPMYDDEQLVRPTVQNPTYPATWNVKYDVKSGNTSTVACSDFAPYFPHFGNFPNYPNIGGVANIRGRHSPNCGQCWKLTSPVSGSSIHFFSIDSAEPGYDFVLSESAVYELHVGSGPPPIEVEAQLVAVRFCGFE